MPNSGAIPGSGGDWYQTDSVPEQHNFLIEHKHTDAKSFRVTTKTLDKIAGEAYRANRRPALVLHFDDGERYVILRACDADWMVE